MCPSFPFSTEGGTWDVIVLIPDHCLSIYLDGSIIPTSQILHSSSKCYSNRENCKSLFFTHFDFFMQVDLINFLVLPNSLDHI